MHLHIIVLFFLHPFLPPSPPFSFVLLFSLFIIPPSCSSRNILSSFVHFSISHFSFLPASSPAMMTKWLPIHRGDPHLLLYYTGKKRKKEREKKGRLFNHCSRRAPTDQSKNNNDDDFVIFSDRITRKPFNINLSFRVVVEWAVHAEPQWRTEECGIEKLVMNKYDTTFFPFSLSRLPRERWKRKHTDYCNCCWLSDSRCLVDDRAHNYMKATYKSAES